MDIEISKKTIDEIKLAVKQKKITVEHILKESRILKESWKENNIFITDRYDESLDFVKESQENYDNNKERVLEGILIVLKDNICTKGIKTTCASKMLMDFIPDYDAEITKNLKDAGAIIIAKSNMDEFAMGSFGNYSFFGYCTNPWTGDGRKYFSGGSSSGSAAAVSSCIAPVSIGTDTGGSVRLPAAWNGIIGFKPTYGVISRYGVIPLATTLDTVSLFGRRVADIKTVFNVLAHKDIKDPSSVDLINNHYFMDNESNLQSGSPQAINHSVKKKVAIIKEFNDCPDVLPSLYKVKDYLESQGYTVEEISVPEASYCMSLYGNIVPMEVMSNFARYDGIRYGLSGKKNNSYQEYCTNVRTDGLGEEVKRRIVAGAYMGSKLHSKERCLQSYGVKRVVENKFDEIFREYDLVLHPTSFSHAVAVEELEKIDPISILKTDQYTVLANILGAPAISIPIDLHPVGLPIGVSLMTRPLQDKYLLEITQKIEDFFQFHNVLYSYIENR